MRETLCRLGGMHGVSGQLQVPRIHLLQSPRSAVGRGLSQTDRAIRPQGPMRLGSRIRRACRSPSGRLRHSGATARALPARAVGRGLSRRGARHALEHGAPAEVRQLPSLHESHARWRRTSPGSSGRSGTKRTGTRGIDSAIKDVRISLDGERLLTLANDRTWRLWDVGSGQQLALGAATDRGHYFAETPDGRLGIALAELHSRTWERLALPPATAELIASARRSAIDGTHAGGNVEDGSKGR